MKIINALLNIFNMILFGLLEGLWLLFLGLYIILWIFGHANLFWPITGIFWGGMILINALFNEDFWR